MSFDRNGSQAIHLSKVVNFFIWWFVFYSKTSKTFRKNRAQNHLSKMQIKEINLKFRLATNWKFELKWRKHFPSWNGLISIGSAHWAKICIKIYGLPRRFKLSTFNIQIVDNNQWLEIGCGGKLPKAPSAPFIFIQFERCVGSTNRRFEERLKISIESFRRTSRIPNCYILNAFQWKQADRISKPNLKSNLRDS